VLPEFRPISRAWRVTTCPVGSTDPRSTVPDYASEKSSRTRSGSLSLAVRDNRLRDAAHLSGIYDELPNLKYQSPIHGGMVPFYAGKIELGFDQIFHGGRTKTPWRARPPEEASGRSTTGCLRRHGAQRIDAATRCGHAFFSHRDIVFSPLTRSFDAERAG